MSVKRDRPAAALQPEEYEYEEIVLTFEPDLELTSFMCPACGTVIEAIGPARCVGCDMVMNIVHEDEENDWLSG